jgi:hypothetical protein
LEMEGVFPTIRLTQDSRANMPRVAWLRIGRFPAIVLP